MLETRLKELEALCAAATPGPWEAIDYSGTPTGYLGVAAPGLEVFIVAPGNIVRPEDAKFIAEFTIAVPELIAIIRKMKADNERLSDIINRALAEIEGRE